MALKALNSVGGFSVGEIPANVILANSDIFTNNFTVNSFANLGNVGNVYIGGGSNGQVLQTDGTGNLSWTSSANVSMIDNGFSNVSIPTSNGNVYINANSGTDQQWIFGTDGNLIAPGSSYIKPVSGSLNLTDSTGNSYIDLDTNNIYLYTDYEGSEYEWNFDNTGNATFPAVGTANLGNYVVANFASFANDLSVTGNANVTGNVSASNFSTTGSAGNITGANVIFANSFTSNGGTVDFNTNNANVLLGNIANVHIYGGSNGQALITDGTGNLSWTSTANVSEIYNGNSNVTIPTQDGPVYINANNGSDQQWTFDNNGQLTLPNGSGITGQPNTAINIYTNSGVYSGIQLNDNGTNSNVLLYSMDGAYNWIFESTGNLILPNAVSGYAVVTSPAGNNISIQTGGAQYSQIILNDNADIILYGNAQNAEYVFGANGTFSVGSGSTIDFNTNGANVLLGSNTNVHIYGGNSGQVLQTDGAGNLSWYSISASTIQNGNSNVTIPNQDGNVYINANAGSDQQWVFDTTGNLTAPSAGTANLGNLVTANYANFANDANIQGNLEVVGNIQTGGGSGGNISGVDYLFANYANLTNDLNANGNVNVQGNVTANYMSANVDLYVGSNANIVGTAKIYQEQLTSVSSTQIIYANGSSYLVGNAAFTYDESSSNVSIGGNANVTGNVVTNAKFIGNTITSVGTYLTIASDQTSNGTYNINLVPGGAGNVDVHSTYITSLADPVNPQDAATKQYVDSTAQGLFIHPAANVLSSGNLNATYTSGGTTLTVTAIIGNNTVQFSTNHGLSANADISFTNAFNGLNAAPDVYWVDTIPAPNQVTLKETYFGPIVANLTPGTSLSQPALAQSGVGATLTNAGTQAVLTIDNVTLTTGQRVLVIGQTNQAYNGIYDVTTAGTGSSNWVLTRSSDGDTFVPQSVTALCSGSYFFISQGNNWAGSSWVLQTYGEIDIGASDITFTQFGQAGSYTGANGINITGTVISANVDNDTTAIVGGNIVVKTSANLVTPNIGDATGSSLTLTGNVLAGNLNSNALTLTDSLTVNNFANVNNFISTGYANVGTDLIVGGNANITGNVQIGTGSGGNISGVNYINATVANISSDAIIGGNANITGNLTAGNSFLNETSITGNANVTASILSNNITSNVDITTNTGNANIAGNVLANYIVSNNDFTTTNGNFTTTNGSVNSNNANIANAITLGNTAIYQATVTTSMITANQTIAQISTTGVTGVEFFVKGVDSLGTKYSVATVQAVTDGTTVDYASFATVNLGGPTGILVVNISGGNVLLQVTPSSSNSTVWTTQFRTI